MTITGTYIFNGKKLVSYSHFAIFKKTLADAGIDLTSDSIKEIFEDVMEQCPHKKGEVDKLYFDHVLYGQLKNIYYQKIDNALPEKAWFIEKATSIINTANIKESIPSQHHDLFATTGFYAMDVLNIENKGNIFLLGYDYFEDNNKIEIARFLIAQVVIKDGEPIYYLAALEINYREKFYLLMFRNLTGIDTVPVTGLLEEEKWNKTMNGYIEKINALIIAPLTISESFRVRHDRVGMYNMCKHLDDGLLEEYRNYIYDEIGTAVEASINTWFEPVFNENNEPTDLQKKSLKDKICSQVLALYLKNKPNINLVDKAKSLGQVGYTTKIEFKANQAGRGATKSKSGSEPIATEDMFHSLYIDFKGALELAKWSLAWFTDEENDYIQTTIYITKSYFKVIFLPTRHLKKETIYHVIRYIDRYRNQ